MQYFFLPRERPPSLRLAAFVHPRTVGRRPRLLHLSGSPLVIPSARGRDEFYHLNGPPWCIYSISHFRPSVKYPSLPRRLVNQPPVLRGGICVGLEDIIGLLNDGWDIGLVCLIIAGVTRSDMRDALVDEHHVLCPDIFDDHAIDIPVKLPDIIQPLSPSAFVSVGIVAFYPIAVNSHDAGKTFRFKTTNFI